MYVCINFITIPSEIFQPPPLFPGYNYKWSGNDASFSIVMEVILRYLGTYKREEQTKLFFKFKFFRD
jgi:hypothetical protein